MIAMAKQRGCTVILCGADATDHRRRIPRQGADFVLLGEGEDNAGGTVGPADRAQQVTSFENASSGWLGPRTRRRTPANSRRPDICDLDALPFPAWDLVDMSTLPSDLAASGTVIFR